MSCVNSVNLIVRTYIYLLVMLSIKYKLSKGKLACFYVSEGNCQYFKSNMNLSSFYSLLINLDGNDYCFNLRKFSGVVGEVGTYDFIPFLFFFQESMFCFPPSPKLNIPGKNFLLLGV